MFWGRSLHPFRSASDTLLDTAIPRILASALPGGQAGNVTAWSQAILTFSACPPALPLIRWTELSWYRYTLIRRTALWRPCEGLREYLPPRPQRGKQAFPAMVQLRRLQNCRLASYENIRHRYGPPATPDTKRVRWLQRPSYKRIMPWQDCLHSTPSKSYGDCRIPSETTL